MKLSKLDKCVHQAFKDWHKPNPKISPLENLALFQQALRQGNSIRHTSNQVLLNALEQLSVIHKDEAVLLRRRFLDGQVMRAIANRHNWSESTAFRKQKEAIRQLSLILSSQEKKLKAKRTAQLIERLGSPSYSKLIGVEQHLTDLITLLAKPETPWIIAVEGMGGIGKTSLADAAVRQIIETQRIDDFAWISAKLHTFNLAGTIQQIHCPPLNLKDLIERLLIQLGEDPLHLSALPTAKALATLQTRLKETPHLIVIDNLESLTDLGTLLPVLRDLANPSKFLLTSRESLFYEPGLYHFNLPELSEADALRLIRAEVQLHNRHSLKDAGDDDLKQIYQSVGGNPLTLRLIAGQARNYALSAILDNLTQWRSQKTEDLYSYLYLRAWDNLNEATRRIFLAMPMSGAQGGDLDFLSAITGLKTDAARIALEHLIALNLIDSVGGLSERRYTIHNLTRTFLQEQVAQWQ